VTKVPGEARISHLEQLIWDAAEVVLWSLSIFFFSKGGPAFFYSSLFLPLCCMPMMNGKVLGIAAEGFLII